MSETGMEEAQIIIFPPSTGCEVAQWLLKLYGIPARVNAQTAPFFQIAISLRGGKTYPYVVYKGQKFSGSTAVSNGLEELVPGNRRLYPQDPPANKEARDLWNNVIAPYIGGPVPSWAYYHLLPHKPLLIGPITKGVPEWQKLAAHVFYRPIAWLIGKGLKLTKAPPTDMEKLIREGFDRIDAVLADGRKFLAGNQLSPADIGLAGLAAPALLEPRFGNGGLLPSLEDAPAGMRPLVTELRARPTGQFVERLYREYR